MSDTIVVKRDELEDIIRDVVKEVNQETVPTIVRKVTESPWMTKEDLMDLTGWSNRTLQHLRDKEQIPYSKHGRKILYPRDGIMEFLDDHLIPRNK